jgi:hypothetical protein
MTGQFVKGIVAAGIVGALSAPLVAHHSISAEFDTSKPITFSGKVTKVEWMNPHIWYYVDVKSPDGSVTTWAISGGAPGQLMRRGITKDLLVLGSEVNVEGFKAKDGSNNGFGQRVTYPDGRNVFTATDPAGRAPQK